MKLANIIPVLFVAVPLMANADRAAPQFVSLHTDQARYAVGQAPVLTMDMLIQPSDSANEIYLASNIGGVPLIINRVTDNEAVALPDAFTASGTYTWEVDVFIENKTQAAQLNATIAYYQNEILQLQAALPTATPAQQEILKQEITQDQELVQESNTDLTGIRTQVDSESVLIPVSNATSSSQLFPRDNGQPLFVVSASDPDFSYREGDSATFFVHVISDVNGEDGPEEFVVRGSLDQQPISSVQGSGMDFSLSTPAFTAQQVGPNCLQVNLFARSKTQADSLRAAISNIAAQITTLQAEMNAATSLAMKAYYQGQIDNLNRASAAISARLEALLSPVGSQTVPFRVTADAAPVAHNFSVAATGNTLRIDVLPHAVDPDGDLLRVTAVSNGARGSVQINPDGTLTYKPNLTTKFRVIEADTASDGTAANADTGWNGFSDGPAVSSHKYAFGMDDYLFFNSKGYNLVSADSNFAGDAFIRDPLTGKITRETASWNGGQIAGASAITSVSQYGFLSAFDSLGANVVLNPLSTAAGPAGGCQRGDNVYVRDRRQGTVALVDVAPDGSTAGNFGACDGVISLDASNDTFASASTNLVQGVQIPANSTQVYERDLNTLSNSLISLDINGNPGNGISQDVAVSQDGRYVVFASTSTGTGPFPSGQSISPYDPIKNEGCWGPTDVYVRDTHQNLTKIISIDVTGNYGTGPSCNTGISLDGSNIFFSSYASNLVSGASASSGNFLEPYIYNGNGIRRAVNAFDGTELNSDVRSNFSATGQYIGYATKATNVFLSPSPPNQPEECYFLDQNTLDSNQRPISVMVSVTSTGVPGSGPCVYAVPSPDGLYAMVVAQAPNLTGVNDQLYHAYLVTRTDTLTYTVSDGHGGSATGTVTVTEPLTGIPGADPKLN